MAVKKQKVNSNLSDSNKSFHKQIDEIRSLVEENLRYTKSMRQSSKSAQVQPEQRLQKLLQENLKISIDLQKMMKKVNHWIAWQRVWMALKILIIVVPIILGIIYLPPLLQQLYQPLNDLLQNFGVGQQIDPTAYEAFINQSADQVNNGGVEIQLPE